VLSVVYKKSTTEDFKQPFAATQRVEPQIYADSRKFFENQE